MTLPSDRAQIWHACVDRDETGSRQKKLTNPTPEGFRGYLLMFVGGMSHDSSSAGSKTRGARSKLVGMGPPPINLQFHDFLTSPFHRFLGRVDVLNHFAPVLSVCCPLWVYLVLFHDYGVKVIVAKDHNYLIRHTRHINTASVHTNLLVRQMQMPILERYPSISVSFFRNSIAFVYFSSFAFRF